MFRFIGCRSLDAAASIGDLHPSAATSIFSGMHELSAENVVDYLRSTGWLNRDTGARAEHLAWGVSNVVLRVNVAGGRDLVVKQSREQLRTESDWFSRLDRIWREMDVMKVLRPLLPDGVVPEVLFEDRENFVFGMEAIDADHVVWKAALLEGDVEPAIAAALGDYLATIHRETANNADMRIQFGDRDVFTQLRVDPFYRTIADVYPDIRTAVDRMIDEMFGIAVCVVHADFSPKNILITPSRIALVDFETGHYGDPAFDLGFFLSHLLLKTVLHADRCDEYVGLATTFWDRYVLGLGQRFVDGPFAEHALQRRTIGHLAGCMLARIDGTSPVDYLPDETRRDLVRSYCRGLFLDPPDRLPAAFDQLRLQLKNMQQ